MIVVDGPADAQVATGGGGAFGEADTVLTALPLLQNTALMAALDGSAPEVYAIGDARDPALIADAIADGALVGRPL